MQTAPIPRNEAQRLQAVKKLNILDSETEERFDNITKQAVAELKVPISTISIIDEQREWFKSCQGLDTTEGPRESSFCGHSMLANEIFIIEDTHNDPRFKDNPQVTGYPNIRFYAGIALHEKETGLPVGVFCIKDTKPRTLSIQEIDTILKLAKQAEDELNKK